MTVQSNKVIVYTTMTERKAEAKKELDMASDIAAGIYASRESAPNEAQLIRNFYYSVFHLIKGISVIESGKDYSKHSSLISYFNRESKKPAFLEEISDASQIDDIIRKGINDLFVYRDKYDYDESLVEEEDYQDAEKIWLEIYPFLENILTKLMEAEL